MLRNKELMEKISSENGEFKKLLKNHYNFKDRIEGYGKRKYLAPEDELEIKKLKKLKLKEKDLMKQIVAEYRFKQAEVVK